MPASRVDGTGGDRLDDGGLAALFAGLDAAPLLLAVSGGPDSMALLHLAARWARLREGHQPRPALHVATVDHGLRPDAGAEAELVAAAATALGLSHAILAWTGPKPGTRIQERARAARYALLAAHARSVGAAAVLTAHHADDQAETVLMRLGRGSGVAGLAGMRRDTPLADGLRLVRPLLAIPKEALAELCRRAGQPFVVDPANSDPRYARARLRAEDGAAARLGLDRAALLRLARRMARADAALEAETSRLEGVVASAGQAGRNWTALLAPVREAPLEILQRLLCRAIGRVADRRIRLDRLETLATALQSALYDGRALSATLAGTRIVLTRDTVVTVSPELPRRGGRAFKTGESPAPDAGRGRRGSLGNP